MRPSDAIQLYLPSAEISGRLAGSTIGTQRTAPTVIAPLDQPQTGPIASVLAPLQSETLQAIRAQYRFGLGIEQTCKD